MLKILLESGPVIVFFITYNIGSDMGKATLFIMISTCISLLINFFIYKQVSLPLLISGGVLLISGIASIWLNDFKYVKMKPTILYMVLAIILYIGYLKKRPLLKPMFSSVFQMDDQHWLVFSLRSACYLVFMAVINEVVWRYYSESCWVAFKVFGVFPLTVLFFLTQLPFLLKHQKKIDKI
ncbi:intracellular septation A family protein [Orientia chuto str. Dubai]|uniref:Inner membrane-spanning protein YciB n=1 Tax=Orientia chuto str. Dubai TaxID=1359168 RepID=A0A0F3MSK0_9RICK|nr:septation protein A [Candidatus Orientia mediorientalis]KJV57559.1 intracellular septation A family protein [Orientia chuto str. Dubai]